MSICPTCESPLLGDESFCLRCGARLVAEEQPRPGLAVPAAIVAGIVLLAMAGLVVALNQVESDAEREATEPAAVVTQPAAEPGGAEQAGVAGWPEGEQGYTVVLATAPDESSARERATAAIAGGVPAGVVRSDRDPTVDRRGWLVFAGRYRDRETADEEAAQYAAAGFPDAEVAFIAETGATSARGTPPLAP